MLVDNGIGIYKTDKNSIPKIIELRMVYILYVVAYGWVKSLHHLYKVYQFPSPALKKLLPFLALFIRRFFSVLRCSSLTMFGNVD